MRGRAAHPEVDDPVVQTGVLVDRGSAVLGGGGEETCESGTGHVKCQRCVVVQAM